VVRLGIALAVLSLTTMIVVDRRLGDRAEFLNAWSMVERLLGRTTSAPPSVVASRLGAGGELVVVVAVNLTAGYLLAWLAGLLIRTL